MKPKNFPGRRNRRRAVANNEDEIWVKDIRFRVGRRYRDERGSIVGRPEGFPKDKHKRMPR